jgi:thioredoxin-related protein
MAKSRACAVFILFIVSTPAVAAEQTAAAPRAQRESGVVWSQSYEVSTKVAATEKSPVLLFFTASWCPWCQKLEREVLVEPKVVSALRKFVCVKLDVDKNHDVAMAYGVVSMPRIVVINTQNEIIGDWLGYHDIGQFLQRLTDIQPYTNATAGTRKAPQVSPPAGGPSGKDGISQTTDQSPAQLTDLLGHKDPKARQEAANTLLKGGPTVMPAMLDALEHEYLGVRIAAWKIICTLNKTDLAFDPWAARQERAGQVKKLRDQLGIAPRTSPSANSQTP